MKLFFTNNRKLLKKLRHITVSLHHFPYTSSFGHIMKPLLLMVLSLCILLLLIPFIFGKLHPGFERSGEGSDINPSFETFRLPETIDVYRTASGKVDTIVFEDYVKGVVSGEVPASFHEEALKAQSVAARTYSASKARNAVESGNPQAHLKAPVCDSTHCQVYRSEKELKREKGKEWMKESWPKICSAVDATQGELLYYNGQLVEQALFHSSSGGKTENSEDVFAAAVPYLISVESPYEEDATHQNESHSFTFQELTGALHSAYPDVNFGNISSDNINIISHSDGGRVNEIKIGNAVITGRQVREALSLPSSKFTIVINGDTVIFTTDGSGHGVGLSQYGADGMAKAGYTYREILNHYYSGTEVY